ncbi:MAG TPA: dockerin type I repeat-containing protein, partial [Thermoanaerobaculia bacterium]|nr:dockerin type I repeat-containing protein [Thermoanaerobaculia bacterium]HUM29784.1 dockerin type I repeat-containing protein [Thermoanaerobaculia bacterium]HXK68059.1 dockerin type I repeat-containing protein [Thermoanaerobaculia bacterium]
VDCLSNLGDVNLNGQISALDASLILQAVVGLISLDPVQQCLADVNENGLVSSLDAAYVLMCTVGNCPGLPAGFLPSCTAHDNCL